jgi:iron complex outermembrane receptor protein
LSNRSIHSRGAWLLAGCSSLLALTLPAPAFAQDQPQPADPQAQTTTQDVTPGPGDTDAAKKEQAGAIVVTGIRGGIRSSINIKRRETGIVEAVSAEDIGKLPDISIAESIARLPGLAAQRVNGRAQVISIRGLSPDFTTT